MVGAVCSPELVEGSTAIYSVWHIRIIEVSYKRRRWPRASSQIEKETLKKRISNIEVMYSACREPLCRTVYLKKD
jgi:hypothetical protein